MTLKQEYKQGSYNEESNCSNVDETIKRGVEGIYSGLQAMSTSYEVASRNPGLALLLLQTRLGSSQGPRNFKNPVGSVNLLAFSFRRNSGNLE